MADFYKVEVAEIVKETKDCSVVTFAIPEHLQDVFSYKQGQYLTLRKNINGEEIRRSYSLCSIQQGDTIELMPPAGDFYVDVDANTARNHIAFAAGSGITPILSIIKTHLNQEPESTFKLFYLNRTVKSIIFKEELERLKNQFFGRFQVFYFLTKEKRDIPFLNGRFDTEKLTILTKSFIDVGDTSNCFLCGPQEMVFLIRDSLRKAGLAKDRIHYELFFTGDNAASNGQIAAALEQKVEGTEITIIDGGKEFHFTMDDDFDTILDGALAAGADLPFACKGGVCSTCKCKIVEGSVEMKVNYALEEDEVAKNLVLSCQAVPTSKNITVDFDV